VSVNYLIQVRRDTAANWTLKNPILAPGEIAFETDTKKIKIGDGATVWNSLADIGNSISAALLTAGGTFTGNVYGPTIPQSHNYIINGAFDFWQRGTSFSPFNQYTADRWAVVVSVGQTVVVSQQTFTPGSAPVAGYEGAFFSRIAWSGTPTQTYWYTQRVEDVRTLANQTVTLSFWAKATSNTSAITPMIEQNFGSGGSGVVSRNGTPINLTTSWQRFTQTFTIPSVSGKTIGANSYLDVRPFNGSTSVDGNNLDIWGVQLEIGSVATPFKRNAPSIQAELAACHRYYYQIGVNGIDFYYQADPNSFGASNFINFPTIMRIAPTVSISFTNTDNAVNSGPLSISPLGFISRANRSNGSFSYFAYKIGFTASAEL
jgi:hypothetical protein